MRTVSIARAIVGGRTKTKRKKRRYFQMLLSRVGTNSTKRWKYCRHSLITFEIARKSFCSGFCPCWNSFTASRA